jgi:hypothetical protein
MSYLNVPRLHFSGTFKAAPSTVNNTPINYDPSHVTSKNDLAWNPNGNHTFAINAQVTATCLSGGTASTTDPIVGSAVASTNTPQFAKLVDLDTEQQMVSQIFGMELSVGPSGSAGFTGQFEPACFNDIFGRVINGQPDSVFSAFYQSVLTSVQWGPDAGSPLLKKLKSASPDMLSIKFVVDGFDDQSTDPSGATNPHFTLGRISGTIGPQLESEPHNFVAGRLLRPNPSATQITNYAYCVVDKPRSVVVFDLGNSVPTTSPAGPPPDDYGTLQAAILPSGGAPIILGTYDYSEQAYLNTALIQEFPLTADQVQVIANNPVSILQAVDNGSAQALLQENPTGAYANATQYVYRMNPGDTATVELIATVFGERAPNQTITVAENNSALQPDPKIPAGTPPGALTISPATVTTGPDGSATFKITASDPGNPRQFIDGQVYGVAFTWDQDPNPNPNAIISVHVYDAYPDPDNPTWWIDVRPLFEPYTRIYPYMKSLVNLDDFAAVKGAMPGIRVFLEMNQGNPQFMPVTRDLSADKLAVILKWMDNGLPEGPRR